MCYYVRGMVLTRLTVVGVFHTHIYQILMLYILN